MNLSKHLFIYFMAPLGAITIVLNLAPEGIITTVSIRHPCTGSFNDPVEKTMILVTQT